MVQQLLRLPRGFAGDAVDAAQHLERAQRNIAKIADRGGYDVEAGSERNLIRAFVGHRRTQSPLSRRSRRRFSASSAIELIRFWTLTMPTTRPLSVTGISARPWPAVSLRMVVPSVSSGRATWKARDITDCT